MKQLIEDQDIQDIQDIIVLNLSGTVQLCVDTGSYIISESEEPVPQTMGDVFTSLEKLEIITPATCQCLTSAVGFRNIAVHDYEAINWDIVYVICERSLKPLNWHRAALMLWYWFHTRQLVLKAVFWQIDN